MIFKDQKINNLKNRTHFIIWFFLYYQIIHYLFFFVFRISKKVLHLHKAFIKEKKSLCYKNTIWHMMKKTI